MKTASGHGNPSTFGVTAALCLVVAGLLSASCGSRDEAATPDVSAVPAKKERLEGKLRLRDKWVEVAPLVLHDGKMDLFVRCRIVQEEAKTQGREVPPLCYDPKVREDGQVTTIRVERWRDLPIAMRFLQAEAEGAHFLVERDGATYQMLDLAYAVRRDGRIQADEIRVVATDPSGGAALTDALAKVFPGARVDKVDMTHVAPKLGPGQGPVPFAPGPPPGVGGQDSHGHGHDDHGHGHDDHGHGHDDHPHSAPPPDGGHK